MTPAKKGSLKSRTTAPMSMVDAPRRLRAWGFGRYPSSRAAATTRSRVSAAIWTWVGASFNTRDTVLCDTPATRAMSRIVVTEVRGRAPRADPAPCVVSLPTAVSPMRSVSVSPTMHAYDVSETSRLLRSQGAEIGHEVRVQPRHAVQPLPDERRTPIARDDLGRDRVRQEVGHRL